MPRCSVIVPVRADATTTRRVLDALLADPAVAEAEILVVAGADRDADWLPGLLDAWGDRVRGVTLAVGAGAAAARNAGASAAHVAADGALVFLAGDAVPRPGWLPALLREADAHPAAAVIGPRLLAPHGAVCQAGVVIGQDGLPRPLYAGFPADHPAVNRARSVAAVTTALLVRRAAFTAMGGFDAGFGDGWDEIDLCLRLRAAGREVRYCPAAVVEYPALWDPAPETAREDRERYLDRWRGRVVPDDLTHYMADGLLEVAYGREYPLRLSVASQLARLDGEERELETDRMLAERAAQVADLLRENARLQVRVHEAERRLRVASASGTVPSAIPAGGEPHATNGAHAPARPPAAGGWAAPAHPNGPGRIRPAGLRSLLPAFRRPAGDPVVLPAPDRPAASAPETVPASVPSPAPPPPRPSAKKVPLLAVCDRPSANGRTVAAERLQIAGWALSPAGVRTIEAFVDGELRGKLSYGGLRPDVAKDHPDYPDATHSGFAGSVEVGDLPSGEHHLVVRVIDADGAEIEVAASFEVRPPATGGAEVPYLNPRYPDWLRKHSPTTIDLLDARVAAASLAVQPTFSVILPVLDAEVPALAAAVDALRTQTYERWELLLCAGAIGPSGDGAEDSPSIAPPPDRPIASVLDRLAGLDPRIKVVAAPDEGGFVAAANAALRMASGEYVALLDPAAVLSQLAFFEIARAIAEAPATDLVYADEDKIDEAGLRWDPFFKPDWSPDLLLSVDYLGPLVVYRRSLVEELGGFRPGFPGAETYDLALRVAERTDRVRHIPKVLSSRRTARGEEAAAPAANTDAVQWALSDVLVRRGIDGWVEPGFAPGRWRIRYALRERPPVTVVVPSGGKLEFLRPCLDSLLTEVTYPSLDVLVVDNSEGTAVAELCEDLAASHPHLRRLEFRLKPFNYSAIMNHALATVESPFVVLFNDDVTALTPDWIEAMLEHAQRPEVGVVGAKLLYPDRTIQHAGVALGPLGLSGHLYRRFPGDHAGTFGLLQVVREFSAVTFACAMMRRSVFQEVGGLDADNLPVAFNDVDLCLRVRQRGYRVIYTPHAVLWHHESVTKTVIAAPGEIELIAKRWGDVVAHDPYYNPNLTRRAEDCSLNMA